MRIICGKYAKREISVVGRTRPLLTRIRQCVFDILGPIEGLTILDLCAGSGSFGLEALSRGAKFVYFFEEDLETARNLMQTLSKWQVNNAKVAVKNVLYLPNSDIKVDLIFLDPPFGHKYTEQIMSRVVKKGWTDESTKLIVRTDYVIEEDVEYWKQIRHETIGISFIHYYRRKECADNGCD